MMKNIAYQMNMESHFEHKDILSENKEKLMELGNSIRKESVAFFEYHKVLGLVLSFLGIPAITLGGVCGISLLGASVISLF